MLSFGVMQGRFTPSLGRGTQFFPFETWAEEFYKASQLGFHEIEFIFDKERYQQNPLWTDLGVREVREVISKSGVQVRHIIADYYLRETLWSGVENLHILERLIAVAKELECKSVELPLVDKGSMKSLEERNFVKKVILSLLPTLEQNNIILGLETDLAPIEFAEFIRGFEHPLIGANYDSGNSAALGYDCEQEITLLGSCISNVHIKDRPLGGKTVELGQGNVNFELLFANLKKIGYAGSLILQAARGIDGEELSTLSRQLNFLQDFM